uniref:Squamosa promoter-binding-like protein 2 n=1 Tax=Aegilops tauschii TaxID=37682 RepID=M8D2Y0_AEGTA
MPSWDLGTVVAPSGGGGGGGGGGGALDLKLGAPTSWRPVPAAAAAAAAVVSVQQQQHPPSAVAAPAKRARAGQGQQTVPPCSVEGCTADLSRCREYHRRHKVPFARGVRRGEEELQEAARRPQPAPPEAAAGSPQSCRLVR